MCAWWWWWCCAASCDSNKTFALSLSERHRLQWPATLFWCKSNNIRIYYLLQFMVCFVPLSLHSPHCLFPLEMLCTNTNTTEMWPQINLFILIKLKTMAKQIRNFVRNAIGFSSLALRLLERAEQTIRVIFHLISCNLHKCGAEWTGRDGEGTRKGRDEVGQ